MQYMLMPLEAHFDGGLGGTGDAFEAAADKLAESVAAMSSSHPHLPINFLRRHAVELYLKSMIVVMHRALGIPYGTNPPDGTAFTAVEGKWRPLHRVHSVAVLWKHVRALFKTQAEQLNALCRTDWQDIPASLDEAIAAIEAADGGSTYFRYPDGRDPLAENKKSSWKEVDPDQIVALMQADAAPVKVMLLYEPDGETLRQAFQYDAAPLSGLSNHLAEAVRLLSAAHTGLRVELAGGM